MMVNARDVPLGPRRRQTMQKSSKQSTRQKRKESTPVAIRTQKEARKVHRKERNVVSREEILQDGELLAEKVILDTE
ncbi:hypothetical protein MAR_017322 [Mya arenaria]|uniref:Uncharacterized protein n=1 Tax=Mya arenaria TaxID=6604 RepID=A0ABY7EDW7_MYAAR|nr:hypothetical protein MAR_017322 [Mya arenaria]